MKKTRIYVANEQSIYRVAVVKIVNELNVAEIIMQAHDGRELLNLIEIEIPDLIIVDLEMPSMRGYRILERLSGNYPEIKIIVLSVQNRAEEVWRVLQSGAHAVVPKRAEPDELKRAVMGIIQQGWYENDVMRSAMRYVAGRRKMTVANFRTEELSARELSIVELVCKEYTNRQIGYELSLSEHTVRNHKVRIMRKMGVKNASGMVLRAYESGYIAFP